VIFGGRGNDTSRFIDDESARTSSTYVDSQKIHSHQSPCLLPPGQQNLRPRSVKSVYVNDSYITMRLTDYKPSRQHGYSFLYHDPGRPQCFKKNLESLESIA